jgi:hypothetical protein
LDFEKKKKEKGRKAERFVENHGVEGEIFEEPKTHRGAEEQL